MRLLWLDDIRDPETQTWAYSYSPIPIEGTKIVWVKSYQDFVDWITLNGLPDAICFDYDLGSDISRAKVANGMSKSQARREKKGTKTGMDAAKWLVEYCMDNKLPLPKYAIQSANLTGKENIDGLLKGFIKHQQNNST